MRFGLRCRVLGLVALVATGLLGLGPTPISEASAAVPYAAQEIAWRPCFEPSQLPSGLPSGAEA
ncbi:MAG TPA: hypothetical protein VJ456_18135, partial [Acidimicrobiia bacterium]|nr:hypothetical protein [Acidimicrobiia bacterium]